MDNNFETLIMKKIIQKELLNELCNKGLINTSNIIKNLDENISKLKKLQEKNENMKNIIVKIPV